MANLRPITTPSGQKELPDADSLIVGAAGVLVEQSSSPSTPTTGYALVYAKTDGNLYFKNDAGTETQLGTGGGGSGTNPVIREYIANDTWTKPTAANYWGALVVCVGAGGGGGSGRRGDATTSNSGGGGGGGGAMVTRLLRKADTPNATYAITIGTGGAGGAAQTLNTTNGNTGTAGTSTSLGSLVVAQGGFAGQAGTTSTTISGGSGGQVSGGTPTYGPYAINGNTGGSGRANSTLSSDGGVGFQSTACPGGGGARGMSTTALATTAGGAGGGIWNNNVLVTGAAGGAVVAGSSGGNGTDVANRYVYDFNNTLTYAIGTGGGGGFPGDLAGTIAGGNGGNGGRGAGGGGGAASRNGANSGAGGNGGNGVCVIIEFYGA